MLTLSFIIMLCLLLALPISARLETFRKKEAFGLHLRLGSKALRLGLVNHMPTFTFLGRTPSGYQARFWRFGIALKTTQDSTSDPS